MTMPRLPRKKKGIADAIREKLTLNRPEYMKDDRKELPYAYDRSPLTAAADDSRVASGDRSRRLQSDYGLADRVEKQQRAAMPPDELERRYGKLKPFTADDGLADDLATADRNLKKYPRRR